MRGLFLINIKLFFLFCPLQLFHLNSEDQYNCISKDTIRVFANYWDFFTKNALSELLFYYYFILVQWPSMITKLQSAKVKGKQSETKYLLLNNNSGQGSDRIVKSYLKWLADKHRQNLKSL